jgi:hypothetical protein
MVPFSRHSLAVAMNPVDDSQTSASCATGHVVKRSHRPRRIQATHLFLQYVILGVFTKLRKVTISFMYVGPSVSVYVRRHGTTHLPYDGLLSKLILEDLSKTGRKIQVLLKHDMDDRHLTLRPACINENILMNFS